MFEAGNVIRLKDGPQTYNLWGDRVELEYFLVKDTTDINGSLDLYSYPYSFEGEDPFDYELVTPDELSEFPDDFAPGWAWWDSLEEEDQDELLGPCWLEYLGR